MKTVWRVALFETNYEMERWLNKLEEEHLFLQLHSVVVGNRELIVTVTYRTEEEE